MGTSRFLFRLGSLILIGAYFCYIQGTYRASVPGEARKAIIRGMKRKKKVGRGKFRCEEIELWTRHSYFEEELDLVGLRIESCLTNFSVESLGGCGSGKGEENSFSPVGSGLLLTCPGNEEQVKESLN